VSVDGKPLINWVIMTEAPLRETYFGRLADHDGSILWRRVHYELKNQTEPPFSWHWDPAAGAYPDQYQMDHVTVLMSNPPVNPNFPPDNGYSSWLQLPDSSVYMVDYTTKGDPKPCSHLYRAHFNVSDLSGA